MRMSVRKIGYFFASMAAKNTLLPTASFIQSKGRLLDLSSPLVMGILNATPDSFYNKGENTKTYELVAAADKMLAEGATILDIGGASSRPGAEDVDTQKEMDRVMPVIEGIMRNHSEVWISIDTTNATVAQEAVRLGARIVNDISSGDFDQNMLSTVAALRVPYIAMHMQGRPRDMQVNPQYMDVVLEVLQYFNQRIAACNEAGITDVILDPGFGFGKTVEHNFELLRNMASLRMAGRPLIAGISRKSMVCKTLKVNPDNALNGTTALHMVALQQGAQILRVHDVKEAVQVLKLHAALRGE